MTIFLITVFNGIHRLTTFLLEVDDMLSTLPVLTTEIFSETTTDTQDQVRRNYVTDKP